jgi:thiol-disulfide isomerase/thioredoxin
MNRYVNTGLSNTGLTGGFYSGIKNKIANVSSTTWIIVGLILLFVIVAMIYYYNFILSKMNTSYKANKEKAYGSDDASSGKSAELLFFYADWCPHCKTAKPIWNDLKTEYENKTINGYKVLFTEVDCSTENAEVDKMMNKYNVEGYPTIKLLKDGQVIEYDAKPSKETLKEFLNTVL